MVQSPSCVGRLDYRKAPDDTAAPQRDLGFTFVEKKPAARLAAMQQALMGCRQEAKWQALIKRAVKADYLSAEPANAYGTLYHNALS